MLSINLKIGVISASFISLGSNSLYKHKFSVSVNIGAHISTLSLTRPMLTPVQDFSLPNLQISVDKYILLIKY